MRNPHMAMTPARVSTSASTHGPDVLAMTPMMMSNSMVSSSACMIREINAMTEREVDEAIELEEMYKQHLSLQLALTTCHLRKRRGDGVDDDLRFLPTDYLDEYVCGALDERHRLYRVKWLNDEFRSEVMRRKTLQRLRNEAGCATARGIKRDHGSMFYDGAKF